MNIKFQICGLIILFVILLLSMFQRKVRLYSELLFLAVLVISILNVSMDIISVIAIANKANISRLLLDTICKAYPITLIMTACIYLIYSLYDVLPYKKFKIAQMAAIIMFVIESIITAVLPIEYYVKGDVLFTYGPAITCTYAAAVLDLIIVFTLVTFYNKHMNPQRLIVMRMWLFMWILCAAVQFIQKQFLLVGFGSAVSVMIMYALLENPMVGTDRSTGVFNAEMLKLYMAERYDWNKSFATLTIFINHRSDRTSDSYENPLLTKAITDYLLNFKAAKTFRNSTFGFTMAFDNVDSLHDTFEMIRKRFKRYWDYDPKNEPAVMITPVYFVMDDSSVAKSAEEINAMLNRQLNSGIAYSEERIIYVDADQIAETREFNIIKGEIQDAIRDDRIVVYYQPIYSTAEDKFVSAEALVRMLDKEGNLVSPGRFIPVAEATGQIKELGNIIFKKSCKFIHNNRIREHGLHYIEVNLSVVQCEKKRIAEELKQIIDSYDITPDLINLELTESSTIISRELVIANMQKMVDYGFQFCLDDFGSGEANLNYIIDMPVNVVKFDMDLTQAYFKNEKANKVMTTIVNMAHDMGLKCVSEGVETKEQLEAMRKLGIDYIQGYYFSKPIPGDEFIRLVDKKNVKS